MARYVEWFYLAGVVFILSVLLTWVLRYYALQRGLMDNPNSRSSHLTATPRGGGLAFVLIFLALLLWAKRFYTGSLQGIAPLDMVLLAGGGVVALIGFIDDHRDLSARLRILVHFAAAGLAIWLVGTPPLSLGSWIVAESWWLSVLFVLMLVWLLNLYNFMDGIDGIASMQAITVLSSASLILILNSAEQQIVLWLMLLATGVAGFLVWNWAPAKIFMGDAASGFLGFSLGVFACFSAIHYPIAFWSWIILLALFIADASWTLGVRALNGEKWYQPHAKHAYQIAARYRQAQLEADGLAPEQARAGAHKWVVLLGLLINLLWLTPLAWLASFKPVYGVLLVVVAYMPLFFMAWRVGAGKSR
ncbi:MAG: glycosyltransferase family 4 protein [Candidatus Thiodiazotropha sp. 6PLUC2]